MSHPRYNASKAITPQTSNALRELINIGLIPAQCTRFELVIDAKDAIRAKVEFLVTEEKLQQIADAFKRNPEEAAQIIRTATVSTLSADHSVGNLGMEKIPDLVF